MPELSKYEKIHTDDTQSCPLGKDCGGCQHLGLSYGNQKDLKISHLKALFAQAGIESFTTPVFYSAGSSHLRDRLDFTLQEGRLGLYSKTSKQILDIEICSQLSEDLQAWLNDFRKIKWPFTKGSFRLRRGPQGQKGLWIDLANIDIKSLLQEKMILQKLQEQCFVEIGQRRKVPFWNGSEYKLKDPEHHIWFQTWMGEQPVPLYCQVASFTQPSLKANKIICDIINSWVQSFPKSRLIEFGSGIGNLTLPALTSAESLLACEIDELSLQGLEKTLNELPSELRHLKNKVQIYRGDFQKKLLQDFSQFTGVLANPPRSGLMNFLKPLEELQQEQRPEFFIYMSCFPESMVEDFKSLQSCGYKINETILVDQFPQTEHYEVLSLLQRK